MILPIHVYGDPVLRLVTEPVTANSDALQQLIDDMIETMHGAAGIGLAAPQVGRKERLFVVDLSPVAEEYAEEYGVPMPDLLREPIVVINPEIEAESETEEEFEEGCLSIPDIREMVVRPEAIRIRYLDQDLNPQIIEARGMLARVMQHEFDHLNGVLFIDLISPFRRKMLKRRLRDMSRGQVEAEYPLAV